MAAEIERSHAPLDWGLMGPILAIVAIDVTGLGVILPLLPFYSERFGATPLLIGLLLAAYSLAQFLSSPWLGRLSDLHGRKPVLIASQVGTLGSLVLLACAQSLPMVFAARIIDGLTAGNLSVASAYAIDASAPGTRRQAIGVVSAGVGVGMMLGPALSALFAGVSAAAPIWAAAALSSCSVFATTVLLPRRPKGRPAAAPRPRVPILTAGTTPALGLLLAFYVLFSIFMSGLALVLAARFAWHGRPLDARTVGLVFTVMGVVNILVQLILVRHVVHRFSDRSVACASFGLLATGFACIGSSDDVAVMGIGVVAASFGNALLRPTLVSALSDLAPPGRQGAVQGVNGSLMATASIVAPPLAGLLIDRHLYAAWADTIVVMAAAGALASLATLGRGVARTPSQHPADPQGPSQAPGVDVSSVTPTEPAGPRSGTLP